MIYPFQMDLGNAKMESDRLFSLEFSFLFPWDRVKHLHNKHFIVLPERQQEAITKLLLVFQKNSELFAQLLYDVWLKISAITALTQPWNRTDLPEVSLSLGSLFKLNTLVCGKSKIFASSQILHSFARVWLQGHTPAELSTLPTWLVSMTLMWKWDSFL